VSRRFTNCVPAVESRTASNAPSRPLPTDEQFIYEANVSVITDDTGEFAGSTAVIRDVTSRKQRERELAQYERIIELAPTALFILDADGSIGWCNDEFADAFAEDKAALLGMPFSELVDRGYYDEQVMTKYAEEVRTPPLSTSDRDRAKYQIQFYSADDTVLVHDVHTKLLPLEDGEFAGTIHAIRDITRRRHYRRELERQNERLEEFATVVSHDLRNPLNVAQGDTSNGSSHTSTSYCPTASTTTVGQPTAMLTISRTGTGPSVGAIRRALDRMDELIDNLLSLARHGQSVDDPEPVELSSLVRDAWEVVDTADAPLECSVDAVVSADEGRARALFENLFRNAIEHGGPDVTVTVGRLEDEAAGRPSKIGFYVADDGPGLETDADEIFEFGRTTTADGFGSASRSSRDCRGSRLDRHRRERRNRDPLRGPRGDRPGGRCPIHEIDVDALLRPENRHPVAGRRLGLAYRLN